MLKQIFVITAFLLILFEIIGVVVIVQNSAARHMRDAEKIIESANETY